MTRFTRRSSGVHDLQKPLFACKCVVFAIPRSLLFAVLHNLRAYMGGLSSTTFESPCFHGRVRARVCAAACVHRYVARMRNSHEVVFRDDFNQSFVSKTTYGVEASFKLPPGSVLHASYSFTSTTVCRPCGAGSHALSTKLCSLLHQVRAC